MPNTFFEIGHKNNNARANRAKLILVEGTDDAYFLDRLLEGIDGDPLNIGIITVGGKGEFENQIKNLQKSPTYTSGATQGVAIIRDADANFDRSDEETSKIFQRRFGVEVRHGEVVMHEGRSYGYFILPYAAQDGDLERLCLETVSETGLFANSREFLLAAGAHVNEQLHKRHAQVYLAAVAGDLFRGAGLGFKRGVFDDTHLILDPLKRFLIEFTS